MENQPDPTRGRAEADGASADPANAKSPRPDDLQNARLTRVHDYLASLLREAHPLTANLGSLSSGLMRIAVSLDKDVLRTLESGGPMDGQRPASVAPSIDTLLRVDRQVDRFAQTMLRVAQARESESKAKADHDRRTENGSDTASTDGPSENLDV